MKLSMFDAEVFPKDSMFGFLTINENGSKELFQSWDPADIKDYYLENKDDTIFVGHNSTTYDIPILEQIIKGKDAYELSQKIVKDNIRARCYLDITSFDIMRVRRTPFSLKLTELISGKKISQTEVDFDIARPLTLEEKIKTEGYNKDDLEQTLYNFEKFYPQFELRVNIGTTFNIPLKDALRLTEAQLAAKVLGAKRDDSLKYKIVKPQIWPTLQIKNKEVIDFYLNEDYNNKNLTIKVCGCEHTLGKGGIHAAQSQVHYDKVLYYDVSGYYNLIMINLNLLPRTLNEEAKQRYIDMYHSQLKMKGIPEKANARKAYKTILLSVFGSMNNEYGDFYDPYQFILVTLSGQLYLIDLLEKLEGIAQVVQSNTDGIMIVPYNWEDESKIDQIVNEWETRTGFNMEKGYLYNLWQRDVNCYFALDDKGNVDYKGDVINYKTDDASYGACRLFDAKEPPIIAKGLIDYLLFDISPEETVQKYKQELINFQYSCKKGTYDYMTCDIIKLVKGKNKRPIEELVNSEKVKPLNRAFAAKVRYDENGDMLITRLIKHKDPSKKGASSAKVSNLPDSIFIYNEDITNAYEELKGKIDYQYYINRIYEKVLEFLPNN